MLYQLSYDRGRSERHVFVGARFQAGGGCRWLRSRRPFLLPLPFAKELELVHDDLHARTLFLRGLVFPLVEAQTAFDKERSTLGDVLRNRLAGFSPRFAIGEKNLFALLL